MKDPGCNPNIGHDKPGGCPDGFQGKPHHEEGDMQHKGGPDNGPMDQGGIVKTYCSKTPDDPHCKDDPNYIPRECNTVGQKPNWC